MKNQFLKKCRALLAIVLFVFVGGQVFAQIVLEDDTTLVAYHARMDSILVDLNFGQMQTNDLLQQGMAVVDPADYFNSGSPAVNSF